MLFLQVAKDTQVQAGIQIKHILSPLFVLFMAQPWTFLKYPSVVYCVRGLKRVYDDDVRLLENFGFSLKLPTLQTQKPRDEVHLPSLKPHLLLRTILPPHYLLSLAYKSTGIYQLSSFVDALLCWFYFILLDSHIPHHVSRNIHWLIKSPLIHVCMETKNLYKKIQLPLSTTLLFSSSRSCDHRAHEKYKSRYSWII